MAKSSSTTNTKSLKSTGYIIAFIWRFGTQPHYEASRELRAESGIKRCD